MNPHPSNNVKKTCGPISLVERVADAPAFATRKTVLTESRHRQTRRGCSNERDQASENKEHWRNHEHGIHSDPLNYSFDHGDANKSGYYEAPSLASAVQEVIHLDEADTPAIVKDQHSNKRKIQEAFEDLQGVKQWRPLDVPLPGIISLGEVDYLRSCHNTIQDLAAGISSDSLSVHAFQGSNSSSGTVEPATPRRSPTSLLNSKSIKRGAKERETLQEGKLQSLDEDYYGEHPKEFAQRHECLLAGPNLSVKRSRLSESAGSSSVPRIPPIVRNNWGNVSSANEIYQDIGHSKTPSPSAGKMFAFQCGDHGNSSFAATTQVSDYADLSNQGLQCAADGYLVSHQKLTLNKASDTQRPGIATSHEQWLPTGSVANTRYLDHYNHGDNTMIIPSGDNASCIYGPAMIVFGDGLLSSLTLCRAPFPQVTKASTSPGHSQNFGYQLKGAHKLDCPSMTSKHPVAQIGRGYLPEERYIDSSLNSENDMRHISNWQEQYFAYPLDEKFTIEPSLFKDSSLKDSTHTPPHRTCLAGPHLYYNAPSKPDHDNSDLLPWYEKPLGFLHSSIPPPDVMDPLGANSSDSTVTMFSPLYWKQCLSDG